MRPLLIRPLALNVTVENVTLGKAKQRSCAGLRNVRRVISGHTKKKTTIAGALHYDTMKKSQTVKLNPIDPRDDFSLMAVTQCAQGQSKSY